MVGYHQSLHGDIDFLISLHPPRRPTAPARGRGFAHMLTIAAGRGLAAEPPRRRKRRDCVRRDRFQSRTWKSRDFTHERLRTLRRRKEVKGGRV
jgi:hypothetical protein